MNIYSRTEPTASVMGRGGHFTLEREPVKTRTTIEVAEMLGIRPYALTRAIKSGAINVDHMIEKHSGRYVWTGSNLAIMKAYSEYRKNHVAKTGRPASVWVRCSECGKMKTVEEVA